MKSCIRRYNNCDEERKIYIIFSFGINVDVRTMSMRNLNERGKANKEIEHIIGKQAINYNKRIIEMLFKITHKLII